MQSQFLFTVNGTKIYGASSESNSSWTVCGQKVQCRRGKKVSFASDEKTIAKKEKRYSITCDHVHDPHMHVFTCAHSPTLSQYNFKVKASPSNDCRRNKRGRFENELEKTFNDEVVNLTESD